MSVRGHSADVSGFGEILEYGGGILEAFSLQFDSDFVEYFQTLIVQRFVQLAWKVHVSDLNLCPQSFQRCQG